MFPVYLDGWPQQIQEPMTRSLSKPQRFVVTLCTTIWLGICTPLHIIFSTGSGHQVNLHTNCKKCYSFWACANVRPNSSNTHECRCISQVHCINTSVDTVCPNIALMFCTIPPEGFKFGRGRLYGFPDIQTQHLLEKWESNMFVLLCVRPDCVWMKDEKCVMSLGGYSSFSPRGLWLLVKPILNPQIHTGVA